MDDDWGYPHFWKPPYIFISCQKSTISTEKVHTWPVSEKYDTVDFRAHKMRPNHPSDRPGRYLPARRVRNSPSVSSTNYQSHSKNHIKSHKITWNHNFVWVKSPFSHAFPMLSHGFPMVLRKENPQVARSLTGQTLAERFHKARTDDRVTWAKWSGKRRWLQVI